MKSYSMYPVVEFVSGNVIFSTNCVVNPPINASSSCFIPSPIALPSSDLSSHTVPVTSLFDCISFISNIGAASESSSYQYFSSL